jgi:sphinganine-1-phosphate aldolase
MIINTNTFRGTIVLLTSAIGVVSIGVFAKNSYRYLRKLLSKESLLKHVNDVPIVKHEIDSKIMHKEIDIQNNIFGDIDVDNIIIELPEEPGNSSDIINPIKDHYRKFMDRANNGSFSGTVYVDPTVEYNAEILKGATTIYKYMQYQNPLHVSDFPIVRQMEAEVVSWVSKMYKSECVTDPCGVFTSGGTESNMSACRAYFNLAKDLNISDPVILVPISAHDSILTKAKDYGEIVTVDIDPETCQVDLEKTEKLLKKYKSRVIAIVGSAPTYAHGIVDPIGELGELAQKYSVYFHVDACLGSLVLPFSNIEKIGFENTGVTSISVDTHKYGYAPKGSSVILFASENIMKYQFYTNASWQGGLYATPGQAGSRSGVPGVTTNYVMRMHGQLGYRNIAKNIIETREKIQKGLEEIDGIEVMGNPQLTVVAIKSDKFNIYTLSDDLKNHGVYMDKMQGPPCNSIHICLTQIHANDEFVERFLKAVKDCVECCEYLEDGTITGEAELYGQVQTISEENPLVVHEMLKKYVAVTLRAVPKVLKYDDDEYEFKDIRSRVFKYFYNSDSGDD